MKNTILKKKLNNHQVTIGSWITVGSEIVAEVMSRTGLDWLAIDMEHSVIELPQAQNLVRTIENNGISPLIRVGENSPNLIKRAMDTGAHGVIVPMVNTAEDAREAVAAVQYPPKGRRGVGLARAQAYGTGFEEYRKWVNKESVVIVQIEHIDAVNNFEAIMETPGVDGFIVGPFDLSGSLGRPGEFDHKDVKSALQKIIEISKTKKYNAGFHVIPPDPGQVNRKIEEGFTLIGFSLDTLWLSGACQSALTKIKGAQ